MTVLGENSTKSNITFAILTLPNSAHIDLLVLSNFLQENGPPTCKIIYETWNTTSVCSPAFFVESHCGTRGEHSTWLVMLATIHYNYFNSLFCLTGNGPKGLNLKFFLPSWNIFKQEKEGKKRTLFQAIENKKWGVYVLYEKMMMICCSIVSHLWSSLTVCVLLWKEFFWAISFLTKSLHAWNIKRL